jgi:hypothetical protein
MIHFKIAPQTAASKGHVISSQQLDKVESFLDNFVKHMIHQVLLSFQACKNLLEKAKIHFFNNLNKFQLYAAKNVLYQDEECVVDRTWKSAQSSEMNDLDQTLQRLRSHYTVLHSDYIHHAAECRDMDTLLKDMRTSLFNLRVAIQSFDDYEIQPISETTQIVNQYLSQLRHYGQEAEGNFFFAVI